MGNTDINKSNEIAFLNAACEINLEIVEKSLYSLLKVRQEVAIDISSISSSEYREKQMREYYDLLNQKIKLLLALS